MPTVSALDHVRDLGRFVSASPSSFHATAEAARRLSAAGFKQLDERQEWPKEAGSYFVIRHGALLAWLLPATAGPRTGFNIFGAHTDSPSFKLKPKSTTGRFGWLQAGVEVYGGPLLNSWLDRELCLAGRLVLLDGSTVLAQTTPLLRFPQLAVHLDRSVNEGFKLDRQYQMNPIWGLGDPSEADLLAVLAESAGVQAAQVAGYDVVLADTQQPEVFGADQAFFASGRLDNLSSVHAGVQALIELADTTENAGSESEAPIAVLAAFDHEEVGSGSTSGASGPILADILARISASLGAGSEDWHRALASSWCLSADAGHAVHPNYADRHDPANHPQLNAGPLLKINANQRYATDAEGAALVARLARQENIPYQEFVSNNDIPCGSTIGPLTATRLGIRTIDVGVPLLSMHSAREMSGVQDPLWLSQLGRAFFAATTGR
ncbi:M18 family aminopeptidase [Psychromicrobium lacuslunae]|uniref:M18 family aminopeptidase n=1 Tax=Psychromicrobium lacuslunae TaxID=1618207 RepID=A0A0D4C146_9MICC|nr:M18 family aminopeptidase [Psychromicrobium lacuslunae]AJT42279.1 aminopeptidase 2 [Psychromicrobium lacuslunae]